MKKATPGANIITELNDTEICTLKDLKLFEQYLHRVSADLCDSRLKHPTFFKTARLLVSNIMSNSGDFEKKLRDFYDR